MPKLDAPTVQIIEDVALDLLHWWQRRHQDGQAPPTSEEVLARVRAKLQAGDAEWDQWEAEHPETPLD